MKKLLFPFVLLLFAVAVQAQIQDPVKFNSELKILAADEAEVVFTAAIDKAGMSIPPTWAMEGLSRRLSMWRKSPERKWWVN